MVLTLQRSERGVSKGLYRVAVKGLGFGVCGLGFRVRG